MVLEVAVLDVKPGQSKDFEAAFHQAQTIISSMEGYISGLRLLAGGLADGPPPVILILSAAVTAFHLPAPSGSGVLGRLTPGRLSLFEGGGRLSTGSRCHTRTD